MRATRQSSRSQLIVTVMCVPAPASAVEVRTQSESTVADTRFLIEALQTMDRELEKGLANVAREARQVPSEAFQTLWRANLSGFYQTRPDPKVNLSRFCRHWASTIQEGDARTSHKLWRRIHSAFWMSDSLNDLSKKLSFGP